MSNKFHGISSLVLAIIAILIGAIAIFSVSTGWGLVYLGVLGLGSQAVLRAYCAKCPAKAYCAHVLPGKAALKIDRRPGPYTFAEISLTGAALALIVGLPQVWLWRYPGAAMVFWGLIAVAATQILTNVCRACKNVNCPINKKAHRQT